MKNNNNIKKCKSFVRFTHVRVLSGEDHELYIYIGIRKIYTVVHIVGSIGMEGAVECRLFGGGDRFVRTYECASLTSWAGLGMRTRTQ